ncbi:unnamed protein product [Litomosoides sigmodontis]|uniref:Uncharacterized protein n=1 Tax=Litomosoides sigmodontis TaxID=42156 RepID=A0A3P6UH15_LITSI|nr:unnamed protein product [Litomosoides sigmodontis]
MFTLSGDNVQKFPLRSFAGPIPSRAFLIKQSFKDSLTVNIRRGTGIAGKLTESPKSNYVQNGKVHFKRLGHLNEELEFRRNLIPSQLPTFLSKKELLSKLSKRQDDQQHIHDNSAEIVDIQEPVYNDYKDTH